jgi:hypothetical protein
MENFGRVRLKELEQICKGTSSPSGNPRRSGDCRRGRRRRRRGGVNSMVSPKANRPPLSRGLPAGGDGFAALDRGGRFANPATMDLTPRCTHPWGIYCGGMLMDVAAPKRAKRFYRSEAPRPMTLTKRDINILAQVAKHRMLSSDQLAMLDGGSAQNMRRCLRALFDHGYLDRPGAQLAQAAITGPQTHGVRHHAQGRSRLAGE